MQEKVESSISDRKQKIGRIIVREVIIMISIFVFFLMTLPLAAVDRGSAVYQLQVLPTLFVVAYIYSITFVIRWVVRSNSRK